MARNWFQHSKRKRVNIYNGTSDQLGGHRLALEGLPLHREVKMDELWPVNPVTDYSVIDETHVRSFVSGLSTSQTYEFDLESDGTITSNNLDDWHYDSEPVSAVSLRETMMGIITSERPDLDIGIWSIPDEATRKCVANPTDRAWAATVADRLIDYRGVIALCDTVYISAYWNWADETDTTKLEEWRAEVTMKVGLSMAYYGERPKVYLWHRGYLLDSSTEVTPEIFEAMLEHCADLGVDVIFWSSKTETSFSTGITDLLTKWNTYGT